MLLIGTWLRKDAMRVALEGRMNKEKPRRRSWQRVQADEQGRGFSQAQGVASLCRYPRIEEMKRVEKQ